MITQSDLINTNSIKSSYFGGITILLLFVLIFAAIVEAIILFSRKDDWNSIRCEPSIMPFAGLYGYDVNENFQYCMRQSFNSQATESLAPVYSVLGGFVGVLGTLVGSADSLRLGFSRFITGFSTIMSEFTERLQQFFIQVSYSTQRIKMLMYRIYATFYAIIYMGMSGIKATQNFGGTVLFGFLDTFCFDPDTLINIEGRGLIHVNDVNISDRIVGGSKIISKFKFMADGQPMVKLGDIIVSTNHYVLYDSKWIKAENHKDAVKAANWKGGKERPLVCFNTEDNCIKIGNYIFRDYDETDEGDSKTEEFIEKSLNGEMRDAVRQRQLSRKWKKMQPAVAAETEVLLFSNTDSCCEFDSCQRQQTKKAANIKLGDKLTKTDNVIGIIETAINEIVELPTGDKVTAATLIWNPNENKWDRAGDLYTVNVLEDYIIYKSFITLPGSQITLGSGITIRDYMEVASPFAELEYSKCMENM
jgi:hypothetical protein